MKRFLGNFALKPFHALEILRLRAKTYFYGMKILPNPIPTAIDFGYMMETPFPKGFSYLGSVVTELLKVFICGELCGFLCGKCDRKTCRASLELMAAWMTLMGTTKATKPNWTLSDYVYCFLFLLLVNF